MKANINIECGLTNFQRYVTLNNIYFVDTSAKVVQLRSFSTLLLFLGPLIRDYICLICSS